ncbi:magnesium transporter [Eubacteriales bacterium KG127]
MNYNTSYDFEEIRDETIRKILEDLEDKKYFKARDEILKLNAPDIADILDEIEQEEGEKAVILFRLLPKDISVDVFAELSSDDQIKIVNIITDKELEYIINELDFDDKIDILEELPANVVDKILENTPKNERKMINTFLNYPDTSAGSLMTPDYISLQKEWTVERAKEHIKEVGMDAETIYTCYVKDAGRKLIGIVSLSTLVVSDDNVMIKDLMRTDYVYESVYDDQEVVAADFVKYGFIALPIVDNEHRLVGIVTVDDILDVIEEETTEDFERMNGVLDFDTVEREYLDIPVYKHVLNRLPWLVILMVSYIVTGSVISKYEVLIADQSSLVVYMPMLMGTAGNTGSQAATLVIRGLATGEIETRDVIKVLSKESRVGFIIGVVLSVLNFARIWLFEGLPVSIAVTVCASMLAIVIFAKVLGSMIPLLARICKIDPALIANPAISSISDTVTCITYFTMAAIFLGV